jgi:hypothetical protein
MNPSDRAREIRVVVFDLDDTLYDCLTQCVGPAHREAAKAMVEAGARATVDEVLDARLALAGLERDVDSAVAATFRSVQPVRVAEAGRRAFYDRDPGALVPFPFVLEVLRRVRTAARAVLLSSGHPLPSGACSRRSLRAHEVISTTSRPRGQGGGAALARASAPVVTAPFAARRIGMHALKCEVSSRRARRPRASPSDVRAVLA